ncbi:phosphogluconate dehydrogenase (NADP(+)-dependent, decarboxylating) [Siphonobacter sp. BAB-5405]|uniref:NADP-dependent phosphogluconate dehydrogenase n=1 Tax=Siphonobacter sp. BAB-5405 TaxID=1864825 RepID=UPI000C7FA7F0|nr:NADP-dependent phosphogluconate dehydrogenase [Siphonobacter sp. BAB-5405]PMD90458.1 phosphogluconate dehydrogenase (NADP(+)-dependent, decarboxylating) [Siphonobacter sp. BAB-5405]
MSAQQYTIGMIGLGTMGRNLLLNMADHDVAVAGYDTDASKAELLETEGQGKRVKGFVSLPDFIESLTSPRTIIMLVPAGKVVDSVIANLEPLLSEGDILIDSGNSHFTDTNRRVAELQSKGIHFFGMGISGGEAGARRGPSMMPGGDKHAYEVMKPVFEAIAAKVDGDPCVTYIGPGASGHFVKMVHNGIEYGLMQLIAETYSLLKNGLKMDNTAIGDVFDQWDQGRLQSFLINITKDIFHYREPGADHELLDDIKDEAKAKGTGKWTSQAAMDLETPIPTIDVAVSQRDLSKYKKLREQAAELYSGEGRGIDAVKQEYLKALEEAFFASMIITYAQGMHMLLKASREFGYELQLTEIAKIWRGGCIIRSKFLNSIYQAYEKNPQLEHLLLDEGVKTQLTAALPGLRTVVTSAVQSGIAAPAYATSLSYFDAFRTGRSALNLIQAQRDYFGAHLYEVIGKEGVFHTEWVPKEEVDLE